MTVPFTHLTKLYMNGNWESVSDNETVINPATEAVIGYAPVGTVDSASKAIAAARDLSLIHI